MEGGGGGVIKNGKSINTSNTGRGRGNLEWTVQKHSQHGGEVIKNGNSRNTVSIGSVCVGGWGGGVYM